MKEVKEIFPTSPDGWVVIFTDHTAWYQRGVPETISQPQLSDHEETIWALCKRLVSLEANQP